MLKMMVMMMVMMITIMIMMMEMMMKMMIVMMVRARCLQPQPRRCPKPEYCHNQEPFEALAARGE